jgi:hypothetical protein
MGGWAEAESMKRREGNRGANANGLALTEENDDDFGMDSATSPHGDENSCEK